MSPAPRADRMPDGVRRCAVLGSPIAHSLSPVIHRTAYEVLGLQGWRYDAFEVDAEGLGGFIAACGPEWVGLSCTAPLKGELLAFGRPTARALALQSGNTYVFSPDGPALVDNTDVAGLLGPLRNAGVTRAASALLVGAGATARSALFALAELGVTDVLIVARDATRAHAGLDAVASALGLRLDVQPWGPPATDRRDVLISVVSARVPDDLARALTPLARVVFDVQYGHGPSPFVEPAARSGVPFIGGLDMLVTQALDQVRLFTGLVCPPEPLLDAVAADIARRE